MTISELGNSALFTPLKIGDIELSHRIVYAPMTRLRGAPVPVDIKNHPKTTYIADDAVVEHYAQRATPGGLLITDASPISLEGGVAPATPGMYLPVHAENWKKVTDAVHAKGGYFFTQIWNAGRAANAKYTGVQSVAPSAISIEESVPTGMYVGDQYKPREMTVDDIKRTINDYANAAALAVNEAGFDGVELHGCNGYLIDQFLHSNVNRRTDSYGGSVANRCRFALEVLDAVVSRIGEKRTGIRLGPFFMLQGCLDESRVETWSHLCREIKKRWSLAYVHMIEPRFDDVLSDSKKAQFLDSWGLKDVTLKPFRDILGDTPLISAGGWNDKNSLGVIESGAYDALAYGRYMLANPDFVERLRRGLPLNKYIRDTFYGTPEGKPSSFGYSDYPTWEQVQASAENKKLLVENSQQFMRDTKAYVVPDNAFDSQLAK